jgi:hypothetical protein
LKRIDERIGINMKSIIKYKNGLFLWIIILSSMFLLFLVHYHEIFPQSHHSKASLSSRPTIKPIDTPILSQSKRQSKAKQTSLTSKSQTKTPAHSSITPPYNPSKASPELSFHKNVSNLVFSMNQVRVREVLEHNLLPKVHSRELILGIAHDTDVKNLAIFMGSLRQVSSTIEVIIFINKEFLVDEEAKEKAGQSKSKIQTSNQLAAQYRIHILSYDIR